MEEQFVNYNGELFPKETRLFSVSNRAFRYGDGVFETMRGNGLHVYFLDLHLERLYRALRFLEFDLPEYFSIPYLKLQIEKLIKRNRLFSGLKIRLSVFRTDGGLYLPVENAPEFLIEAEKMASPKFELNKVGLNIGIYNGVFKNSSPISGFKTSNSLLYVMASVFKQKSGFDDALIINNEGSLVEATSSNIFLIKDGKLYTPPLKDGCVDGVMRKVVMQVAEQLKIEVFSHRSLNERHLLNADEVFLSNAIVGIRWVSAYGSQRFYKKLTEKIFVELNQVLLNFNSSWGLEER